ncbi:MAG: hypothetical protein LBU16_01325 [Treponema sp.]|nr:hypothetical protein [Treponema sp.]
MGEEKITFDDWNLADQIETKEDLVGTLERVIRIGQAGCAAPPSGHSFADVRKAGASRTSHVAGSNPACRATRI